MRQYRCQKCGQGGFGNLEYASRHAEKLHDAPRGQVPDYIVDEETGLIAPPAQATWNPGPRCILLGFISLAVGLYFLLIAPGGSVGGMQIANLHSLTLGETFTITGAIFLSAGWLAEAIVQHRSGRVSS